MEQGFKVAQKILEGGVAEEVKRQGKQDKQDKRPYTEVQTEPFAISKQCTLGHVSVESVKRYNVILRCQLCILWM